ncbi:glycosyltransferase family 4 protein [Sporosarcina sp. 6E9]|uniref:glycosyltransferase family 4 protein n=1 Tax=Sporosarcina sp. 6E9 TaxID=2819235 RepID=UPI001B305885
MLTIKIVQVITQMDTVGGAQIHVRDLSVGLANSGHEVYLVAGGTKNIHSVIEAKNIDVIYSHSLIRKLNIKSDIKAIIELRKILKEIQPDLVATHSSKAGIVGRIAGWSLRIPTVFTAHGWSFTDGVPAPKKSMYKFFEKVIGLISDGVIAVSEYDRELAIKHKVLPEHKVHTIHNGVHDQNVKEAMVYPKETPTIIMVARFAAPKRQLQLLKALNQLRHIQWKVSFAGDGPLLHEAKEFVKQANLCDRVEFLGNRDDITELLHKSSIFALLSDWEGLPLSILEAMRCGLPILASNVGGVKETVYDSKNGYVVSKNDQDELVKKLTLLLTSTSLRLEMGRKGRLLFEENFTFEKMYNETDSFYKVILSNQETTIQTTY